jgi:hypothetical protein
MSKKYKCNSSLTQAATDKEDECASDNDEYFKDDSQAISESEDHVVLVAMRGSASEEASGEEAYGESTPDVVERPQMSKQHITVASSREPVLPGSSSDHLSQIAHSFQNDLASLGKDVYFKMRAQEYRIVGMVHQRFQSNAEEQERSRKAERGIIFDILEKQAHEKREMDLEEEQRREEQRMKDLEEQRANDREEQHNKRRDDYQRYLNRMKEQREQIFAVVDAQMKQQSEQLET